MPNSLDAAMVRDALDRWPGEPGEGWPSWAFSNHDAPRHVSRWLAGCDRAAVAGTTLMLLMSLRGNAFLYQGEELGLPQADVPFERLQDPEALVNWPVTLGRDGARTPMPWTMGAPNAGFSAAEPWLPLDPRHDALAVDIQLGDPASTLAFARRMIALRKARPALRTGTMRFLDAAPGILAFEREQAGDRVLCVFNLSGQPCEWTPPADGTDWTVLEMSGVEAADGLPSVLPPAGGYLASA